MHTEIKKIYNHPSILELEISGNTIIRGLSEIFILAIVKKLLIKETSREFIEELDKLIERNGLYVSTKVESYIPAQYKTSKLENEDDVLNKT